MSQYKNDLSISCCSFKYKLSRHFKDNNNELNILNIYFSISGMVYLSTSMAYFRTCSKGWIRRDKSFPVGCDLENLAGWF